VRNEDNIDIQLEESGESRHNVEPTTAIASIEIPDTGTIIREALKASIRA